MQDNISLFRTQNRGLLHGRQDGVALRRLVLRGDRNYLRALRAAEMAAWENARPARPQSMAVRHHTERRATAGVRTIERALDPWLPHHILPIEDSDSDAEATIAAHP